jgi:hypothetical protein
MFLGGCKDIKKRGMLLASFSFLCFSYTLEKTKIEPITPMFFSASLLWIAVAM